MRTVAILAVALCALSASAQEAPLAPKDAAAPIRRVTVYPDRALVSREVRLDLARGTSTFAIKDLPAGVLNDSVRAKLSGHDKARLRGVEIQTYQVERVQGDKPRELQEQIDRLSEQLQEVAGRQAALRAHQEFILSIKAAVAREASERVTKDKPAIEDWTKTATFIEESLLKVAEKERKALKDRRELEARLRVVQADLAAVTSRGALTRKRVLVTLSADAAGAAVVEISYGILGAGWVPSYDLHADLEKNEAIFHYYGEIVQNTGEDWTNVELSLSTADPAKSVAMPELKPLTLGAPSPKLAHQGQQVDAQQLYGRGLQRNRKDLEDWIQCQNEAVMNNMILAAAHAAGAAAPTLQMASHVFRIATAETAPSERSPHKVAIAVTRFRAAFERVCTPAMSPYVFLRTDLANENDFPYMPGDLHIFRDNHYVGASALEMVSPREKFEVFVGVDESVKATRRLDGRRVESGTMRKVNYAYTIKLENFRAKKTTLKVFDRVPVSRDSDIDVFVEQETTKPTEHDAEGRLTWVVELDPGQTKEIKLVYRVFHPAGKAVAGLE